MNRAVLAASIAGALLLVLLAAFFWPKASNRWDDGFTASLAGRSYYENFDCACIGFAAPQLNCLSCTQYTDCYGIPVSCMSTCRKLVNGTWEDVSCATGAAYPRDRESCEAQGGRWGPIGLSPEPVCVMPTKDAGKPCWDSSQCEGSCVAELSRWQYEWLMATRLPILTAGACTASNAGVGCNAYVQNGVVTGILCVD
jgi:hypothetical protein